MKTEINNSKNVRTRLLIVLYINININIALHSLYEVVKTKIRDDTRWSETNNEDDTWRSETNNEDDTWRSETNNEDGGDLVPKKVEQINVNLFIDTNKSNKIKSGLNEMRVNKLIMEWVWVHEMKHEAIDDQYRRYRSWESLGEYTDHG